jgi:hypothetical protein
MHTISFARLLMLLLLPPPFIVSAHDVAVWATVVLRTSSASRSLFPEGGTESAIARLVAQPAAVFFFPTSPLVALCTDSLTVRAVSCNITANGCGAASIACISAAVPNEACSCPPGFTYNASAPPDSECVPCPPGTQKMGYGNGDTACLPCPPGFTTYGEVGQGCCAACPPGVPHSLPTCIPSV